MRFGTKLYRQVVEIPIGTYCAPLVADLSLFCYVKVTMMSLPDDKQADKTITLSKQTFYAQVFHISNNFVFVFIRIKTRIQVLTSVHQKIQK